jgi:anti-sigma factor RsiW
MVAGPEHARVAELLGVYALDATDAADRSAVEAHLADCPECRRELDGLRGAAAALAEAAAADGEEPPGSVWSAIASRIGIPESRSEFPVGPAGAGPDALPSLDEWRQRRHGGRLARPRVWLAVAAAGAAAAIAALTAGLVNAESQVHRLQSASGAGAGRSSVQAALAAPGARVVAFRSAQGRPVAKVVVQRDGQGIFEVSSMPRLPASEIYQLWASIGGRPISLGLLGPEPVPGAGFSLGNSAASASELLVTVEPAGGVPSPDTAPVATAPLV